MTHDYLIYIQLGVLFLLGFALGRFSHKPLPEQKKRRKKTAKRQSYWRAKWATRNRTMRKIVTRRLPGDGLVVTEARWDAWQEALTQRFGPTGVMSPWQWYETDTYYCVKFWLRGAPLRLYFMDSMSGYHYRLVLITCGSYELTFPRSNRELLYALRSQLRL